MSGRAAGPGDTPAAGSATKDWRAWHDGYDVPDSLLARRLAVVRGRIRLALDSCPPGPLQAVSICAGQGRDLLAVLASHPRGQDVRARLVELDPRNAAIARDAAQAAGLGGVEVVVGDAARTGHYLPLVPADLVLACGIFGNVTAADIERTIAFLGCMTATRWHRAVDPAPPRARSDSSALPLVRAGRFRAGVGIGAR